MYLTNCLQYDPFAFLDAMATPFEALSDPKKKKHDILPADDKEKSDASRMPHCKACTDFKTWMQLTANPRRVKYNLLTNFEFEL